MADRRDADADAVRAATPLLPAERSMAVKQWLGRLRPAPLYLMLVVTALFFVLQLVMSHMTHALTLLVDAYHMLCNLIALAGCIVTIKYGSASTGAEGEDEPRGAAALLTGAVGCCSCCKHVAPSSSSANGSGCSEHHKNHSSSSERRLKNTFGWARIDVLVMLIGCVFLNSLCFSLIVEALQTLVHIGHQDEMHHPIPVLIVACIGLFINAMCYLFIGGYTFHQASFLHVTSNGEVILDHIMNKDSVQWGQRRLSAQARQTRQTRQTRLGPASASAAPPSPPGTAPPLPPALPLPQQQRQGPWEMCRDTVGCFFVIICALVVYFTDERVAKFVDPVLSIVSAITLLILSYPYMRESGSILLQTIPDTININSLRQDLLKAFPDILNVHDLHVWRLTASRVFSTAHIIFLNNKDYSRITREITDFFHDQGITQVTIQPEFFQVDNGNSISVLPNVQDNQCLVPCFGPGCYELHCCANKEYKLTSITITSVTAQNAQNQASKSEERCEVVPELTCQIKGANSISEEEIEDKETTEKGVTAGAAEGAARTAEVAARIRLPSETKEETKIF